MAQLDRVEVTETLRSSLKKYAGQWVVFTLNRQKILHGGKSKEAVEKWVVEHIDDRGTVRISRLKPHLRGPYR